MKNSLILKSNQFTAMLKPQSYSCHPWNVRNLIGWMAKEIWDILKVAHEGTKPMRKAKIEIIKGQLH
jgi:hypothetical protein